MVYDGVNTDEPLLVKSISPDERPYRHFNFFYSECANNHDWDWYRAVDEWRKEPGYWFRVGVAAVTFAATERLRRVVKALDKDAEFGDVPK